MSCSGSGAYGGVGVSGASTATRFATHFSNMARHNLVRQFGEAITYFKESGTVRAISGIVERREPQIVAEVGDVPATAMIIRVLNSVTEGISSVEIDTGGDTVSVPLRQGEGFTQLAIVQVLNDANGMTRFLVQ